MSDLVAAQDTISPLVAVLWVFYPMAALVLIELLLRAFSDDDDDNDGVKESVSVNRRWFQYQYHQELDKIIKGIYTYSINT